MIPRNLHRLDIGTSGVFVFAKNADSAKQWGNEHWKEKVRKQYLAIVARDAGILQKNFLIMHDHELGMNWV